MCVSVCGVPRTIPVNARSSVPALNAYSTEWIHWCLVFPTAQNRQGIDEQFLCLVGGSKSFIPS